MGSKIYISADEFLMDSWRLASLVRGGSWRPDWVVGLWRGGAGAGVAVHEYLKASGWDARHVPLKCASYSGIDESDGNVVITLGEETFGLFAPGEKILAVDDVFDTGRTAAVLADEFRRRGLDLRFATVYIKPGRAVTSVRPDYCVRDLGDEWIVFPHEIDGLSPEEIRVKNPALAELLAPFQTSRG